MKTVLARLWTDRQARVSLTMIAVLAIIALAAPLLAPYDPTLQIDLSTRQHVAPSVTHPFGTDFFSRDLLSRVLYGARISLMIAFLSVVLSITVGTAVGLMAGIAGGVTDTLLMRVIDAALAVPRIFLLLVIVALWSHLGLIALVMVLGMTNWFDTSRLVRAEVLSLKSRDFVVAAEALGVGMRRTLLRHVLPNIAAPVIVTAALGMGQIVLVEAGLSYLGLGVQPPTPSWGRMIADGQDWLVAAPWVAAVPGMAIVITVVAFSLLGDRLRRALDPRAP